MTDILWIPFYSYVATETTKQKKKRDVDKPLNLESHQFQKGSKLPLSYATELILIP